MRIVLVWALALCCAPLSAQQVPLRGTREVFRFGGPDAADAYAFSSVPSLVVAGDGTIYARVGRDAVVLVFDSDGRFLHRIGRRGAGPGEFEHADAHGLLGDTLWVRNWPTPRISRFGRDGSHISTVRTPFDFGHSFAAGAAGLSGLLASGSAYAIPPQPVIGVAERIRLPLVVGPLSMRSTDTIALLPNPRGLFIPGVGTWAFDPIPSSPLVAVNPRGTGIAVVEWADTVPGSMTVRLIRPDGDVAWQRRFRVVAAVIPGSVRDSLIREGVSKAQPQVEAARRRGTVVAGSLESQVERALDLPRHYAPARRAIIGVDGSIWVEQAAGLRGGTWFVITRDGEPAFQLRVPPGFVLHDASLESVWGTSTDELDVPYMHRLRIVDMQR